MSTARPPVSASRRALLLLAFGSLRVHAERANLIFIRHGEKLDDGSPGLSKDGANRASWLAQCIGNLSSTSSSVAFPAGPPTALLAPAIVPGKSTRGRDTLMPLGNVLRLPVDTSIEKTDHAGFVALADSLLVHGGTVLAAWEHSDIAPIVASYGPPGKMGFDHWPNGCDNKQWPEPPYIKSGDTCYERIWAVTLTRPRLNTPWLAVAFATMDQGFQGMVDGPCLGALGSE